MAVSRVVDATTVDFFDYIQKHLRRIIDDTLAQHTEPRLLVYFPLHGLDENLEAVQRTEANLRSTMLRLASGQDCWPFLWLFRKVPIDVVDEMLGSLDRKDRVAAFERSVLLSTNLILANAPPRTVPDRPSDRYRWTYTSKDYEDALRQSVLGLLQAKHHFLANSLMRRQLLPETSMEALIDSYNERLHSKRGAGRERASLSGPSIILPVLLGGVERKTFPFSVLDKDGTEHEVLVRNYIPMPRNADLMRRAHSFLDTREFDQVFTVPFATWWNLWVTINEILRNNLPLLWPENTAPAEGDVVRAAMEKLDDYCETGLGATNEDRFIEAVSQSYQARLGNPLGSEQVRRFVSVLTAGNINNPDFIEKPYLFYRLAPNVLAWDYLRHGALLKAMTRHILDQPSCDHTRRRIGECFESEVKTRLAKVPGVNVVKWNGKVKRQETLVWQIDVVAVTHRIALLVEAKHWYKSVRHDAGDGVEVSSNQSTIESVVRKYDENLRSYTKLVHAAIRRQMGEYVDGALCVVCALEPELIPSTLPEWWLRYPRLPRICTLEQLIEYLDSSTPEELRDHPAFVRFAE